VKVIEKTDITPLEPILCSIKAAIALTGRSERSVIDMIATGQLRARKSDRRTLVEVASIREYCASLPVALGTPNRRRPTSRRQRAKR
jgi:hypothetical protein